jgi:hypothetical protein
MDTEIVTGKSNDHLHGGILLWMIPINQSHDSPIDQGVEMVTDRRFTTALLIALLEVQVDCFIRKMFA